MPKTRATISIENVVASATLDQQVDLNSIVKVFPGLSIVQTSFPA